MGENADTQVQEILSEASKMGINTDGVKVALQNAAISGGEATNLCMSEAFQQIVRKAQKLLPVDLNVLYMTMASAPAN